MIVIKSARSKTNRKFWYGINQLIEYIRKTDTYDGYYIPKVAEYIGAVGRLSIPLNKKFKINTEITTTVSLCNNSIFSFSETTGEVVYVGTLGKHHKNNLFLLSEGEQYYMEPFDLTEQVRANTLNKIIAKLEEGKNHLRHLIK
jgi:hypothetical protein